MPARRRRLALTLSELLVVVVVLGVISLIVVPSFQTVLGRSEVEAQLARDEAVARNSAAILAFRDGTTPAQALTIAVDELPPAPGVSASNGYTVGTDASDSPEVYSYALNAGNLEFVTMHDADTAIGCFVHQLGISSNCAVIELDSPSSEVGAGDVTIPGGGGLAGGGGGITTTTTAPPPPEPAYGAINAVPDAGVWGLLDLTIPGGAHLAGEDIYAVIHVDDRNVSWTNPPGWRGVDYYQDNFSWHQIRVFKRDTPHSGQETSENVRFTARGGFDQVGGAIIIQPGTYEGTTFGNRYRTNAGTPIINTTGGGNTTISLAYNNHDYGCSMTVSEPATLIDSLEDGDYWDDWNYYLTSSDGTAQGVTAGPSHCYYTLRWASLHFTSP